MTDRRLIFGNPGDIALSKANRGQRDRLLSRPEGVDRNSIVIPPIPPEEFDRIFAPLDPVGAGEDAVLSLQRENGTWPQYVLSPRVIKLTGWYGDPDTQEDGRIGAWVTVNILGVKRPLSERGPAPSWKVQEVPIDKTKQGSEYYIGRRGKYFIGETPENPKR